MKRKHKEVSIDGNRMRKQKCSEKKNRRRVEKNRECWNVEHLAIGSEVAITFTVIFKV
jgi:hypothetical protein